LKLYTLCGWRLNEEVAAYQDPTEGIETRFLAHLGGKVDNVAAYQDPTEGIETKLDEVCELDTLG